MSDDPERVPAKVLSVCRVSELRPDAGIVGVTAIHKRPVSERLSVGELGLYGDIQADRKNHGGPNKAVYVYSQAAADVWAKELGFPVEPGSFGENLRTQGLDVDNAVIGERWQIGDRLVLEVTMPRIPCMTFGRYRDEPRWVKRFTQKGLAGAYTRRVVKGDVGQGDSIQILSRPDHGVTVKEWFTSRSPTAARTLLAADQDGLISIAVELREVVVRLG